MSCDGILVHTQFGDICIPIYREEQTFRPPPPPEKRAFEDLVTLVAISQRIAQISDHHVRDTLSRSLESAAKSLALPKGVKLGDRLFGGGPAVAAPQQKVEMNV